MHHKRGRPKNARAGCLLCKPHKMNGWNKAEIDGKHARQRMKVLFAKLDTENGRAVV